jgi:hypothetical protein
MTDLNLTLRGLAEVEQTLRRQRERWDDAPRFVVGTGVEYAVYLEFGTSQMDPKPFFAPVLDEARGDIPAFINRHTRTDAASIRSAEDLVETLALAVERRIKAVITRKGLIDTGTLRASVQAVPATAAADLPGADDITPSAESTVEVGG